MKEVKVAEDVELKTISRKLGGYSGADITNVCRDASMMSMRRKIAGLKPSEIRNLDKSELDLPVRKLHYYDKRTYCKIRISRLISTRLSCQSHLIVGNKTGCC